MTTVPDILDQNTSDNRVLSKLRSPIGFFILRNDGMLRIAAIQQDPVPGRLFFSLKIRPCIIIFETSRNETRSYLNTLD